MFTSTARRKIIVSVAVVMDDANDDSEDTAALASFKFF
jgi:hypothetical protein